MKIVDHKVEGDNRILSYKQTPNGGKRALIPDTIIIHYTAGGSSKSAVNVLTNSRTKVSAHFVVGKDGDITQLAKCNTQTWHAGRSAYGNRTGFNKYSIGIEIDNPGYLVKNPNGNGYVTWFNANRTNPKSVAEGDIFWGVHRNGGRKKPWMKYPDACTQAVYDLCETLINEYNIKYILGHEEIAPKRKLDPGPAFPLDDMRNSLLKVSKGKEKLIYIKRKLDGKVSKVNVTSLNIRSKPNGDKVADPLKKDHEVKIIEEENGWVKVKTEVVGWIFKEYVDRDNSDDEADGIVTANTLNIRSKPQAGSSKVANPLSKGTEVDIIDQENEWLKVGVFVEGWVTQKYLKV